MMMIIIIKKYSRAAFLMCLNAIFENVNSKGSTNLN